MYLSCADVTVNFIYLYSDVEGPQGKRSSSARSRLPFVKNMLMRELLLGSSWQKPACLFGRQE